jgi:mono/diheme cytochrome c family protein
MHVASARGPRRAWLVAGVACAALACSAALGASGCNGDSPRIRTGAELFHLQGCKQCHGPQGRGGSLGPDLVANKAAWTPERLVEYLRDPPAFVAKDPRLREQAKRYSLPMPKFDMLREEELEGLAQHVLELK